MKVGNTFPNLKEEFRNQLKQAGVSYDCVIDEDTFAEISCVSGCFKSKDGWVVYDTDERAKVCDIKKFGSEQAAYSDLATRLGFSYVSPKKCIVLDGNKVLAKVIMAETPDGLVIFDRNEIHPNVITNIPVSDKAGIKIPVKMLRNEPVRRARHTRLCSQPTLGYKRKRRKRVPAKEAE